MYSKCIALKEIELINYYKELGIFYNIYSGGETVGNKATIDVNMYL